LEVFTLNSRVTHKKNFLYNGGACEGRIYT
jgi:hypothetical protein